MLFWSVCVSVALHLLHPCILFFSLFDAFWYAARYSSLIFCFISSLSSIYFFIFRGFLLLLAFVLVALCIFFTPASFFSWSPDHFKVFDACFHHCWLWFVIDFFIIFSFFGVLSSFISVEGFFFVVCKISINYFIIFFSDFSYPIIFTGFLSLGFFITYIILIN